ncbi:MFS transporter [Flavitalea flava]
MTRSDAPPANQTKVFTRYQVFMIALISILQFTVILDFMVIAPLGATLIRTLHITPSRFGLVVSAYAFSAGIAGILTAGFADKFDRKKMLLFFYIGFIIGTLLCGIAPDYHFLLYARMITGVFGGVLFATNMAIISDLFSLETRGRVMGYVQMSFSVAQVAGLPIGLVLANQFGWHAPFLMIVVFCLLTGIAILRYMKPVVGHLKGGGAAQNPLLHLVRTASQGRYIRAFLVTAFLSTGGFMMMPYSSAFLVRNVGVDEQHLWIVFAASGVVGLFTGPLIGKWSDRVGKYRMMLIGSALAAVLVVILTNLTVIPLWEVVVVNTLMYTAVFSRMIPTQALVSAVPDMKDRGAFMSINGSVQQLGGGIASIVGGWIISQNAAGLLVHYDTLGYVTVGAFLVCALMMYNVNKYVMNKPAGPFPPSSAEIRKPEVVLE